ncbi:ferric reductase-like transmembrane domain-containing protein [Neobacillus dielmonensis]|uniref:ferric reductase-like transmembrane domain-containing protein n=1 Tax=Neobacillus dielmonensis TaxID=1347369 RepID=UPI0005A8EC4C|nr:ferric reductase-like transmembrane domain-containing protein [Neobacillus dielmonensis]
MEMFEWYMIRSTGLVAYFLLYLSAMTGIYTQIKKSRKQKVATTNIYHESLSDWALYLTVGHVGFLLIDKYMGFKWTEVLIPFATDYKTIANALGIIGLYFLILAIVTSKARKKIGYQRWQKLHALNPILYILVTLHTLFIGTDIKGYFLAIVNIIPIVIMGGFLFRNHSETKVSQ